MHKQVLFIGLILLAVGIPFFIFSAYDYNINYETKIQFLSIFEVGIPIAILSAGIALTVFGFAMKKPERQMHFD